MNAVRRVIATIVLVAVLALGSVMLAAPAQARAGARAGGPLGDLGMEVTSLIGVPLSL
ncbi:hypothetical protein AB0D11_02415 [Streptomyces monashensis]|uniref:hypothetical protein n=1 Tax=Streptomyces monashensis TaxID=1678012 RepID=UPI0033F9D88B